MDLNSLLSNFQDVNLNVILVIIHVIGVALGAGGALMSDFLFFHSIKDKKISQDEFDSLMTISRAVWAGLAILILSGITMFALIYFERGNIPMLSSPRWQAKLTWVGIVLLNGIFFRIAIFPRMQKLIGQTLSGEILGSSIWYFAVSGVFSIVSWYSIIIISLLPRTFRPSYFLIIGAYFLIVLIGTILAKSILKKKMF